MSDPRFKAPGWYDDDSGSKRWWDGERWGAYAPPPPTAANVVQPQRAPMNGAAVAGLVLGLVAIVAWWVPVLGIVVAALGVVVSSAGLWLQRSGQRATGRGAAAAGLVLSVLSIFLFAWMLILMAKSQG